MKGSGFSHWKAAPNIDKKRMPPMSLGGEEGGGERVTFLPLPLPLPLSPLHTHTVPWSFWVRARSQRAESATFCRNFFCFFKKL